MQNKEILVQVHSVQMGRPHSLVMLDFASDFWNGLSECYSWLHECICRWCTLLACWMAKSKALTKTCADARVCYMYMLNCLGADLFATNTFPVASEDVGAARFNCTVAARLLILEHLD